jgi:soluble lytic murein transglycosylase-like protein
MGRLGAVINSTAAGLALLTALLVSSPAHAADRWIYLQQHDDGVRSYTDLKPVHGPYTRIKMHGRPTASASCFGLTSQTMADRAALYEPLISKYASAHGVPPRLVSAVMRVESCYDRQAVSRVGARGLMQLMPSTAAQLGVHDTFDPEQNIQGGVRYLARLMTRFNNDLHLALAAYNAGPEAVDQYRGVPPYPETKSYVGRILKLYDKKA